LGLFASPSTPPSRQRSIHPYTVGMLTACMRATSGGLWPR
jgi:hypothetical protein